MGDTVAPANPAPAGKPLLPTLTFQALGAIAWGIFFILTPIGLLTLGAIIGVPVLFWRELARMKKHPFLPGFLVRAAVFAAIVTGAIYAPMKSEDQLRVEGLQGSITLADLSTASSYFRCTDDLRNVRVSLPSERSTVRQVAAAIEQQTGMKCAFARCATDATILGGCHIISVQIERPPAP